MTQRRGWEGGTHSSHHTQPWRQEGFLEEGTQLRMGQCAVGRAEWGFSRVQWVQLSGSSQHVGAEHLSKPLIDAL